MKGFKLGILILILSLAMMACNANDNENTVDNKELSSNENAVESSSDSEEVKDPFKGYFWEISDEDSTIYLYGSIHMASESLYPLDESVEEAFTSSDYLVVEADVSNVDSTAYADAIVYAQGTLFDHLSEEGIEKYTMVCEEMNINPQMYQNLKIWVAGSTMMQFQLMRSDYSANYGVDMHFLNQANEIEKAIISLEGMDYQLNMMNNFSDEIQEDLFITSLGTLEETIADFESLYNLYVSEDEAALEAFINEDDSDLTTDPEVEKIMLTDRNKNMADKIHSYMQGDEDYFVVVGVAHYLGDDSVIDYLEEMGYTVNKR